MMKDFLHSHPEYIELLTKKQETKDLGKVLDFLELETILSQSVTLLDQLNKKLGLNEIEKDI